MVEFVEKRRVEKVWCTICFSVVVVDRECKVDKVEG